MSVEAVSAAISFKITDSTRKIVLLGLAMHAGRDGTAAHVSLEQLARYADCSVRTVQRHLARLLADGIIRKSALRTLAPGSPQRFSTRAYDVLMDAHKVVAA